jgi:hypothetical protein
LVLIHGDPKHCRASHLGDDGLDVQPFLLA